MKERSARPATMRRRNCYAQLAASCISWQTHSRAMHWLKQYWLRTSTAHMKCRGTTRAGQRCQMTPGSSMVDAAGRSVAAPLRKGSSFCLFHAVPFSTKPVRPTGPVVVIYLDLETTGVDVSRDRIVEIAATQGFDSPHMPGASYAEVAYVPEEILRTPGAQAVACIASLVMRLHKVPLSQFRGLASSPSLRLC